MTVTQRSLAAVLSAILLTSSPTSAQLAGGQPEWYLPVTDGCRLFVKEYGHGTDTVIVLHGGWGAEHSYLMDAFVGLEDRYHLVFYDQRGSLRSPCPDSAISVAAHVADLERLRDELGLNRVHLVGHSMGTYLAMQYLAQHPDRVAGLVLLGTLLPQNPPSEDLALASSEPAPLTREAFFERPAVLEELRKHGLDRDSGALSAKDRTNAWRIRFAGVNLYHVERWRQLKGGQVFYNDRAGRAAAETMPESYDFTDALREHRCRIWIIDGDHDYLDFGATHLRRWSARVPNVRLVILEHAGHVAWIDAPAEFRRVLAEALADVSACRP
ncbi:MAG TPA: alpha/beta hydrolase [Longimicrobiales bacterium]